MLHPKDQLQIISETSYHVCSDLSAENAKNPTVNVGKHQTAQDFQFIVLYHKIHGWAHIVSQMQKESSMKEMVIASYSF